MRYVERKYSVLAMRDEGAFWGILFGKEDLYVDIMNAKRYDAESLLRSRTIQAIAKYDLHEVQVSAVIGPVSDGVIIHLDDQEAYTIIEALHYFQKANADGLNNGDATPLDAEGIDKLIERINFL